MTTTTTRPQGHRRPAPLRRIDALLAAALAPVTLDFSRMTWDSDRDETWM